MLEMRHRELPTHLYASDDDPLLADPVEKTPGAPTRSYMQILITLHMDYLVVALPRGLIPRMMTDTFGNKGAFMTVSITESLKGFLVFLTSPLIGALADSYGRKPLLLFCVVSTALPFILYAATSSIWVLVVATPLSGLGAATFSVVFAYISDLVPPSGRAKAFGMAIGMGMGLAFVTGPVTGAYLAMNFGTWTVFACCLVITLANCLYSMVFLKESREDGCFPKFEMRKANPLNSLGMLTSSPLLYKLAVITLLYYTALWGVIGNMLVYATTEFEFTPKESGMLLSFFGVCGAFIQTVGMRALVLRYSDVQILQIGLMGSIAMLLVLGLAWEGWLLFVSMFFGAVSMLTFTATSSLTSISVTPDRQAEAQGVINGVKSLTEGVGPLLTGVGLAFSADTPLPGLPFLLSSAFCVAAMLVSRNLSVVDRDPNKQLQSPPSSSFSTSSSFLACLQSAPSFVGAGVGVSDKRRTYELLEGMGDGGEPKGRDYGSSP